MNTLPLNNISQYSNVSELLDVEKIEDLKKNQKTLKTLFEGNFATMGYNSEEALTIEKEIEELEALIHAEEGKIKKWNLTIFDKNNEIAAAKTKMDEEIVNFVRKNEEAQNDTEQRITDITDEVMDKFAKGEISQSEIADKIQEGVGNIDASFYNLDTSKINELSGHIKSLSDEVANLIQIRNITATKITSAQSSMQLLNEMYQMQIESLGRTATRKGANQKVPVFTPSQQAYVDELFAKYHTSATPGVDQFSAGNKQVQNLADALGLEKGERDKYVVTPEGEDHYANSILQEMHDKGFDFVQAMYALDYIMGMNGNVFNYDPNTNAMTVAYGHNAPGEKSTSVSDRNSNRIFTSLINQTKTIWKIGGGNTNTDTDTDTTVPTPPTPPGPGPLPTTPPTPPGPGPLPTTPTTPTGPITPTPTGPNPPTAPSTTVRTDPIGWTQGDTTYDFIIDRNGDNKFNAVKDNASDDDSEFLGALDGIKELTKYDANKDGVIAGDEITNMSNDGIKILTTDHKNMGYGFKTLEDAGIVSIDLNSMKRQNHTNVNGNQVKNTFGITFTNNKKVTAYQSLDDNNYLSAVYSAVENHNIVSKIDYSKASNKKALDLLTSDKCLHLTNDEVDKLKSEVNDILTSMKTKKESSEKKIEKNKRDLKADLNASITQSEHDAYEKEEEARLKAENEAAREAEKEARKVALSRKITDIVLLMKNLYNEKGSDYEARMIAYQNLYNTHAAELQSEFGIDASDIASIDPDWVNYFDKNLNTQISEFDEALVVYKKPNPEEVEA